MQKTEVLIRLRSFWNYFKFDCDEFSKKKYNLYYSDIEVKYSIKNNIRFENQDMFIKTWIEKHNGIKTIFSYELSVDIFT